MSNIYLMMKIEFAENSMKNGAFDTFLAYQKMYI